MARIGALRQEAADRARENAKAANRGKKRGGIFPSSSYVKGDTRYPTEPLRCECPVPWNGGEESCVRCGKRLPANPR